MSETSQTPPASAAPPAPPAGPQPAREPELSVVIPIYNEEQILERSVGELVAGLGALGIDFEIVLAENGSRDRTVAIAEELAARWPERLRWFSYPEPNYGGALREGIFRARGRFLVCEEIDLCDVDFHERALALLRADEADLIIGSKAMAGAHDHRPVFRRAATRVYNAMLRASLGFSGTDTHGLKAMRRSVLAPIAARCIVDYDVFASELVIRAEREGVRMLEIPVEIEEKRAPSINLVQRVPRVLGNLGRLMVSIHLGRDLGDIGKRRS
ncbi:glycosyltransferase [Pseudenhygromyxa sp. WMMC2535]|nr:glycosyltransferase [Pseudenhygromyxa sp. WMMC2535]